MGGNNSTVHGKLLVGNIHASSLPFPKTMEKKLPAVKFRDVDSENIYMA